MADEPSGELVAIPGHVIAQLINEISPIIEKYERAHVILAGLTLAIIVQNPNLTPPELHEIVMGASQYIVSAIEMANYTIPTSEIPQNLVN